MTIHLFVGFIDKNQLRIYKCVELVCGRLSGETVGPLKTHRKLRTLDTSFDVLYHHSLHSSFI